MLGNVGKTIPGTRNIQHHAKIAWKSYWIDKLKGDNWTTGHEAQFHCPQSSQYTYIGSQRKQRGVWVRGAKFYGGDVMVYKKPNTIEELFVDNKHLTLCVPKLLIEELSLGDVDRPNAVHNFYGKVGHCVESGVETVWIVSLGVQISGGVYAKGVQVFTKEDVGKSLVELQAVVWRTGSEVLPCGGVEVEVTPDQLLQEQL
eukprot:TRINITY_DN65984_c0_g1_i4.p1 TRINITY_DN65984_c0_g1~~TRINITY_DN65984_c0_g1_i4.p1  ORF type:complete len:209 (+),score=10.30 TRINITY_DN65984_c0_g1_i4:25-627(+)